MADDDMDEFERSLKAWTDAEKARQEWSEQYFVAYWQHETPKVGKVLDHAALEEYKRLDKAASEARVAFERTRDLR
jgi:hypothetical protein